MFSAVVASDAGQSISDFLGFEPSRFYLQLSCKAIHSAFRSIPWIVTSEEFELNLRNQLVNHRLLRVRSTSPISASLLYNLRYFLYHSASALFHYKLYLYGRRRHELSAIESMYWNDMLSASIANNDTEFFSFVLDYGNDVGVSYVGLGIGSNTDLDVALRNDYSEILQLVLKLRYPVDDEWDALICNAYRVRAARCIELLLAESGRNVLSIPRLLPCLACASNLEMIHVYLESTTPSYELLFDAILKACTEDQYSTAKFLWEYTEQLYPDLCGEAEVNLAIDAALDYGEIQSQEPDVDFIEWMVSKLKRIACAGCDGRSHAWTAANRECRKVFLLLSIRGNQLNGLDWIGPYHAYELEFLRMVVENARIDISNCALTERLWYVGPTCLRYLIESGIRIPEPNIDDSIVNNFFSRACYFGSFTEWIPVFEALFRRAPCYASAAFTNDSDVPVTPLGMLEFLGTPMRILWTNKTEVNCAVIEYVNNSSSGIRERTTWEYGTPDDVQIEAISRLKELILQFGGSETQLFDESALAMSAAKYERFGLLTIDSIERLINGKADVNAVVGPDHMTTLSMYVQQDNSFETCKYLLERGAQVVPPHGLSAFVSLADGASENPLLQSLLQEYA
jgi:hypothetical protein